MNNDLISRSALLEQVRFSLPIDSERRRVIADCVEITRRLVTEAPTVDAVEVVRCENCTHQQKVWHDDKRMKKGGFFIYSCKLNEDPFVTHVVDGNPGEFCYAGKRRADDATA